jgi:lipopolysaccharide/colanic/teichoic acid biosynthesis glycosyltransferase
MPSAEKRACDLLLALAGLVFSLPLAPGAAVAMLLDTGVPVFYRQERVGRNGRLFMSLKFRSMGVDAEAGRGPVQATAADARVTRTGRLLRGIALDELPQLINILKGDMSVVGRRPAPKDERVQGASRRGAA